MTGKLAIGSIEDIPRIEPPCLALQDVVLAYDGRDEVTDVLGGLSLSVKRGSFVAIIGPSGCGKTTLLRALAGLIRQQSGSILVNGVDPIVAREQRQIGFVFQQPVLFDWRTVEQNVQLPGEIFGQTETIKQAGHYIDLVGLRGYEDYYPTELSGGMQSRVSIARALIHKPDILLLDEPFADLDEVTRERMNLELLRIWTETATTMVFVSHNLEEAVFLADEVHVLSARPSRVLQSFYITLPRPRSIDMLESESYILHLRDVREAVRAASNELPSDLVERERRRSGASVPQS